MTEKELSPTDYIKEIFYRTLDMADVARLIKKNIVLDGEILKISGEEFLLTKFKRIFLVGVGTAAYPMAQSLEIMLGDKISQGIIIVPPGCGGKLEKVQIREVTSPLVDKTSHRALRDLLFMTSSAGEDDLIILLLSKGTSEILESLPDTVTLADYNSLLKGLRAAGARKEEINAIKMHMSLVKGGQFLNFSHPATLATIIISDEPGGDIWRTYQAPTYYDHTTYEDCRRVLIRYRLPLKLSPSILNHFNLGIRRKIPETVKPDDEKLNRVFNFIIHNSSTFAADAHAVAEELGFSSSILSTRLEGNAEQMGRFFGHIMRDIIEYGIPLEPPCAFIASGRTEDSDERRLEEVCAIALSCAIQIEGIERAYFLAGTSFNFEKGGYVGCFVNCDTINQVRSLGADPIDIVRERKAHKVLLNFKQLLQGKYNPVDCGDLFIMMVV